MRQKTRLILSIIIAMFLIHITLYIYNETITLKFINANKEIESQYKTELQLIYDKISIIESDQTKITNNISNLENKYIEINNSIQSSAEYQHSGLVELENKHTEELYSINTEVESLSKEIKSLSSKVNSIQSQQKSTSANTYNTNEDILSFEPGTSSSVAKKLENMLNACPSHIKNKLQEHGWSIILSKESLRKRFNYSVSIAGITVFDDKVIYLDNRDKAIRSLYHEIGHAIDCINGIVSDTEEFKRIYELEKLNFKYSIASGDKHEISSSMEYFAAVFDDIIRGLDSSLQQSIPQAYNFVKQFY